MIVPSSLYIEELRRLVGTRLLLLPSVAASIVNEHGELLLQEKSGEPWSLPAGMIEPGETPEQAIVREVGEETGLVVQPRRLLGVFGGREFRYRYPNGDEVEYTVVLFRCVITGRTGRALDDETASLRYVARRRMPPLALPYPHDVLFGADAPIGEPER